MANIYRNPATRGADLNRDYDPAMFRRDIRSTPEKIADTLRSSQTTAILLLSLAIGAYVFRNFWEPLFLVGLFAYQFHLRQKFRLVMRMPAQSKRLDWGNVFAQTGKPELAKGILHFGICKETFQEIWITDADARSHMFIFATTGGGKTEFLVGLSANALSWASGLLYIDGKGDIALYAKMFALAKRFGREDDILVLNFMTGGGGGVKMSNTMNPYATASLSDMANMTESLMSGGSGGGNSDMWKDRARTLLRAVIYALGNQRDTHGVRLDVALIRNTITLSGFYDLYMLAEEGKLSPEIREQMKAYLGSLPGWNWQAAREGKDQSSTTRDQHGYLEMQLTSVLSALADSYGFIFRHQLPDIDLDDIVLNRRIFTVLLPALEKSDEETGNLGKIVVAQLKAMMGRALGSSIEGPKGLLLDKRATTSPSPFMAILDEVGVYVVPGLDTAAAQARSLGFSLVFAAQDMVAAQKRDKNVIGPILGNTNLKIGGRILERETFRIFSEAAGKSDVLRNTGYSRRDGAVGSSWHDQQDARIESVDRLDQRDLARQENGQFHLIFGDTIVRSFSFYANPKLIDFRYNRFMRIDLPHSSKDVLLGQSDIVLDRLEQLPEEIESMAAESGEMIEALLVIMKRPVQANAAFSRFGPGAEALRTCRSIALLAGERGIEDIRSYLEQNRPEMEQLDAPVHPASKVHYRDIDQDYAPESVRTEIDRVSHKDAAGSVPGSGVHDARPHDSGSHDSRSDDRRSHAAGAREAGPHNAAGGDRVAGTSAGGRQAISDGGQNHAGDAGRREVSGSRAAANDAVTGTNGAGNNGEAVGQAIPEDDDRDIVFGKGDAAGKQQGAADERRSRAANARRLRAQAAAADIGSSDMEAIRQVGFRNELPESRHIDVFADAMFGEILSDENILEIPPKSEEERRNIDGALKTIGFSDDDLQRISRSLAQIEIAQGASPQAAEIVTDMVKEAAATSIGYPGRPVVDDSPAARTEVTKKTRKMVKIWEEVDRRRG